MIRCAYNPTNGEWRMIDSFASSPRGLHSLSFDGFDDIEMAAKKYGLLSRVCNELLAKTKLAQKRVNIDLTHQIGESLKSS